MARAVLFCMLFVWQYCLCSDRSHFTSALDIPTEEVVYFARLTRMFESQGFVAEARVKNTKIDVLQSKSIAVLGKVEDSLLVMLNDFGLRSLDLDSFPAPARARPHVDLDSASRIADYLLEMFHSKAEGIFDASKDQVVITASKDSATVASLLAVRLIEHDRLRTNQIRTNQIRTNQIKLILFSPRSVTRDFRDNLHRSLGQENILTFHYKVPSIQNMSLSRVRYGVPLEILPTEQLYDVFASGGFRTLNFNLNLLLVLYGAFSAYSFFFPESPDSHPILVSTRDKLRLMNYGESFGFEARSRIRNRLADLRASVLAAESYDDLRLCLLGRTSIREDPRDAVVADCIERFSKRHLSGIDRSAEDLMADEVADFSRVLVESSLMEAVKVAAAKASSSFCRSSLVSLSSLVLYNLFGPSFSEVPSDVVIRRSFRYAIETLRVHPGSSLEVVGIPGLISWTRGLGGFIFRGFS